MELEHIAAFDRQTVVAVISAIVETDAERGYIDHYRFGVFPRADGGSMVIVMEIGRASCRERVWLKV